MFLIHFSIVKGWRLVSSFSVDERFTTLSHTQNSLDNILTMKSSISLLFFALGGASTKKPSTIFLCSNHSYSRPYIQVSLCVLLWKIFFFAFFFVLSLVRNTHTNQACSCNMKTNPVADDDDDNETTTTMCICDI